MSIYARGLIWGHWNSLHEGQQFALHTAFSSCQEMIIAIFALGGDEKRQILPLADRQKNLEKWLSSNKYAKRSDIRVFDTIEDGIAATGEMDFQVMVLSSHDAARECALQLKAVTDTTRTNANKEPTPYLLIKPMLNEHGYPLSDTKYDKRKVCGLEVAGWLSPKSDSPGK